MKTKVLLIAAGLLLTAGIALHIGNRGECPLGKPCQKLLKSETRGTAGKTIMKSEVAKVTVEKK